MPKPCADRSAGRPRDNTNADHAFRRIRKAPQVNGGDSGTGPRTLPLARTLVKPDASSGVRAVPLDVRRQPAGCCLRARAREPPRRAHRLQRWSRPARRVAGAHHGRRGTRARWAAGARFVARPRGRTDRLERAMLRGLERLHRGRDAGARDPRRVAVAGERPVRAGLPSSAALTVAAAKALGALGGARLTGRQLAGVAYRAEHDRVGVRCGVMDQMIAALAKPGYALLVECASAAMRYIPFRGRLLLVDTGVRHELAAGRLNERRAECEAAVARLRLELPELVWLASWPVSWLGRLKKALPEPLRARALHVIGETARTRFGAQLLARGRLKSFGRLLYESHESCRRLYQCSAPELDLVVAAARRAGARGSRARAGAGRSSYCSGRGKGEEGRVKGGLPRRSRGRFCEPTGGSP